VLSVLLLLVIVLSVLLLLVIVLSVLLLLVIVLFVLLRLAGSGCHFGIFRLFLKHLIHMVYAGDLKEALYVCLKTKTTYIPLCGF
jgi:hypothetical protein